MNQAKNICQHLLAGATTLTFIALPYQIAQAATIGLLGTNSNAALTTFLQSNGNTVVDLNTTTNFTGLDTVILLRTSPTDSVSTDLQNFVLGGGRLITEFTGADWALNTANLLNADVTGGATISPNTTITFTQAGIDSGLSDGIGSSYADGSRTQSFRTIPIGNIGTGVDVLANKPSTNPVAIIGGASGLGSTLVIAYDWADDFANANTDTQQLILNALNYPPTVPTVPEPATIMGLVAFGLAGLATARKGS
jgi:PEP-CTERM motif